MTDRLASVILVVLQIVIGLVILIGVVALAFSVVMGFLGDGWADPDSSFPDFVETLGIAAVWLVSLGLLAFLREKIRDRADPRQ